VLLDSSVDHKKKEDYGWMTEKDGSSSSIRTHRSSREQSVATVESFYLPPFFFPRRRIWSGRGWIYRHTVWNGNGSERFRTIQKTDFYQDDWLQTVLYPLHICYL
jgi:hypothetical protein